MNGKMQDRFSKILRVMVTHDENRFCFDCHQRGPTYINATVGSFVCTSCGGALRKYNHRIKSILMSNFTPAEMELLRKRGNKACRKIYSALGEGQIPSEKDFGDAARDEYLRKKYQLNKWYREPTAEIENEAIKENQQLIDRVDQVSSPQQRTSSSTGANAAVGLLLPAQQPTVPVSHPATKHTTEHPKQQHASVNGVHKHHVSAPVLSVKSPTGVQQESTTLRPPPTAFTQSTNDAFTSAKTAPLSTTPTSFFTDFVPPKTTIQNTVSAQPQQQQQQFRPTHFPITSDGWANAPFQATCTDPKHFSQPTSMSSDKYAALAELDGLFKNVSVTSTLNGSDVAARPLTSNTQRSMFDSPPPPPPTLALHAVPAQTLFSPSFAFQASTDPCNRYAFTMPTKSDVTKHYSASNPFIALQPTQPQPFAASQSTVAGWGPPNTLFSASQHQPKPICTSNPFYQSTQLSFPMTTNDSSSLWASMQQPNSLTGATGGNWSLTNGPFN